MITDEVMIDELKARASKCESDAAQLQEEAARYRAAAAALEGAPSAATGVRRGSISEIILTTLEAHGPLRLTALVSSMKAVGWTTRSEYGSQIVLNTLYRLRTDGVVVNSRPRGQGSVWGIAEPESQTKDGDSQ